MATHKLLNAVSEREIGEGSFDEDLNKFTIGTKTYYLAKARIEEGVQIWNMYINTDEPIGDFTNKQGVVEIFKIVPIPEVAVNDPNAMHVDVDQDAGSRKKSKKSKSKKSKRKTKGGKKQKKQSKSRKQRR
jgi:hypothetical protein